MMLVPPRRYGVYNCKAPVPRTAAHFVTSESPWPVSDHASQAGAAPSSLGIEGEPVLGLAPACAQRTVTSTRRLRLRFPAVAFDAAGESVPKPCTTSRERSIPCPPR